MITIGADACDSDAQALDGDITPIHVPTPRRVMVRGDLVDGECIACPSILPPSGARHADLGNMLNISGDRLPALYHFCGPQCKKKFCAYRLTEPYQITVLARLSASEKLSSTLQTKVRVGDTVFVCANPRTGIGKAVLPGEGMVKSLAYNKFHGSAVFNVQTSDAFVRGVYPDGLRELEHIAPAMRRVRNDQTPNHATTAADQRAAIATQRRNALDKEADAKSAKEMLLAERVEDKVRLRDTLDAADTKSRNELDAADARFEAVQARLRDERSSGRARLNAAAETAVNAERDLAAVVAATDAQHADALSKARKRARVAESKAAASAPDAGEVAALKKQLAALQVFYRACARCAH